MVLVLSTFPVFHSSNFSKKTRFSSNHFPGFPRFPPNSSQANVYDKEIKFYDLVLSTDFNFLFI
jgi:hypothetical protein